MTERINKHDPIMCGVKVQIGIPLPNDLPPAITGLGVGITALARRTSDNALVAVTNAHNAVLPGDVNPQGNELLFQPTFGSSYQQTLRRAAPIGAMDGKNNFVKRFTDREDNEVDACYFVLNDERKLAHTLHSHPLHTPRRIIPSTKTPGINLPLVALFFKGGEKEIRVNDVGQPSTIKPEIKGHPTMRYRNQVRLDIGPYEIQDGDSGSPCFYKVSENKYQLCCIIYAGQGTQAWAFPARRAEELLGIRFGNTPPRAVASPVPVAYRTKRVNLNGSNSIDPDGGDLTYLWEFDGAQAELERLGLVINNSTSEVANFIAPDENITLRFKLTVTDVAGEKASDTVTVKVIPARLTITPAPTVGPAPRAATVPPRPESREWTAQYDDGKIQVKVLSAPEAAPPIKKVRVRLEFGTQPSDATVLTKWEAIGKMEEWWTALSSSDSQWREGSWAVQIRYENLLGSSSYSAAKSVIAPTVPTPPVIPAKPTVAPGNVTATATHNSVTVTWGAVDGATGYDVQLGDLGEDEMIGYDSYSTTGLSYTVENLKSRARYYYRVRARNDGGAGPWSEAASLLTSARPSDPDPWLPWQDAPPPNNIRNMATGTFTLTGYTRKRVEGNWGRTGRVRENLVTLEVEEEQTRTITWEAEEARTKTWEKRVERYSQSGNRHETEWREASSTESRWVAKSSTETRWAACTLPDTDWKDAGPTRESGYGTWTNTNQYRGIGANRERKQTRTVNREKKQTRTRNCGTETQWVPTDPATEARWVGDPPPCGPWTDTGEVRVSSYGTYSRTGKTRGSGASRKCEESRTNRRQKQQRRMCDNIEENRWISTTAATEARWVSCPEVADPDPWGSWADTGKRRVKSYGGWSDTGNRRENQILLIIEKEQKRTVYWEKQQERRSQSGNRSESRWIGDGTSAQTQWVYVSG